MTLDIIIPTMRTADEVAPLVAEIERTAGCDVRVIATCQPVSAARNRNIGLDQSTSDPLITVDDDVEQFPHGWALRIIGVLESHPNCVMVSAQLARPGGRAGLMMGGCQIRDKGVSAAMGRKLPTACVAIRRNDLRFFSGFRGGGWEDTDYCAQLRQAYPKAEFLVCHDVWVVHRNEMKNQDYPDGPNWQYNKALYKQKWGLHHA